MTRVGPTADSSPKLVDVAAQRKGRTAASTPREGRCCRGCGPRRSCRVARRGEVDHAPPFSFFFFVFSPGATLERPRRPPHVQVEAAIPMGSSGMPPPRPKSSTAVDLGRIALQDLATPTARASRNSPRVSCFRTSRQAFSMARAPQASCAPAAMHGREVGRPGTNSSRVGAASTSSSAWARFAVKVADCEQHHPRIISPPERL